VRDDGDGMDEATRQRCLEPFFTTKAQRGSGLGLAMIYGMVRRHDGTIDIISAPNKGTTVRIILPLKILPQAHLTPLPSIPPFSHVARILCVDDEPKIRSLLAECLAAFGHQITTTSNGAEALRLLEESAATNTPFELLITDLGMPAMDGRQLARQVRNRYPTIPIIMITGWGSNMNNGESDAGIIDAVVSKPPRLDELGELIVRLTKSASRSNPS
jgi:CheY-like chemotaxis protein